HLAKMGIKGVKLHPEYQGFYIDDPVYFPFYEKLASVGLIALFHAGYDPGPFTSDHAEPHMFLNLLNNIPDLTVVAGHLGGLLMWDSVLEHLCGKNIWFDTAAIHDFIDPELFLKITEKHDCEKILMGSDTPWESPERSIEFIMKSKLTDQQKEMILGKNAEKILNFG
ncbi:MAG: amidohydrolase family protein, partial [Proteobacteria bacterium]|nr:amidohydrolase family protein [Pseudomonadota bacterium]